MKKTVLVSGSSSQLGIAIVRVLLQNEYSVFAGMRSNSVAFLKKIFESHKNLNVVDLDITNIKSCESAAHFIEKKVGHLDVLINAAGVTIAGDTLKYSDQEFLSLLDTNTVGAFRLIKSILPLMTKGQIINITSISGLVSLPYFSIYGASKQALEALGLGLRHELMNRNIFLTNIAPGAIYRGSKKYDSDHKPLRVKFPLLAFIFKMTTDEKIADKILKTLKKKNPAARIIVGRDAKIIYLIQKLLPFSLFDYLLKFMYRHK